MAGETNLSERLQKRLPAGWTVSLAYYPNRDAVRFTFNKPHPQQVKVEDSDLTTYYGFTLDGLKLIKIDERDLVRLIRDMLIDLDRTLDALL